MRLVGLLCCALLLAGSRTAADERTLAIIVNPSRTDHPSRVDCERIYLRQRRFWDDGSPIVPLNRGAAEPEREAFSRAILNKDGAQLETYWNEQYFHGVFPPAVVSSSEAMRRYVAADRNAIGYVWSDEVTPEVRVVMTLPSGRQP
jgi:hypothetical protein